MKTPPEGGALEHRQMGSNWTYRTSLATRFGGSSAVGKLGRRHSWRQSDFFDIETEVEAQRHSLDLGQCGVICVIVMREICGNQLCSVVLRGANCSGRPLASD